MIIKKINIIKYGKKFLKLLMMETENLKIHEKIGLFYSDMITDKTIKIPSITIVIKSLIEKNRFYLELALLVCTCFSIKF